MRSNYFLFLINSKIMKRRDVRIVVGKRAAGSLCGESGVSWYSNVLSTYEVYLRDGDRSCRIMKKEGREDCSGQEGSR